MAQLTFCPWHRRLRTPVDRAIAASAVLLVSLLGRRMMARTLSRVAVTEIATASTLSALAGLTGGFQALLMSQWGDCQFFPLCWLYVGRGCGQPVGPLPDTTSKLFLHCRVPNLSTFDPGYNLPSTILRWIRSLRI